MCVCLCGWLRNSLDLFIEQSRVGVSRGENSVRFLFNDIANETCSGRGLLVKVWVSVCVCVCVCACAVWVCVCVCVGQFEVAVEVFFLLFWRGWEEADTGGQHSVPLMEA